MGFTHIDGTFWEAPLDVWDTLNDIGPRCAYVATYFAVPHMIQQGEGFIVNISSPGAKRDIYGRDTDSPELSGRAIAYLAADRDVMARTGKVLTLAELAQEYGFSDIDGTVPVLSDQQRAARETI